MFTVTVLVGFFSCFADSIRGEEATVTGVVGSKWEFQRTRGTLLRGPY